MNYDNPTGEDLIRTSFMLFSTDVASEGESFENILNRLLNNINGLDENSSNLVFEFIEEFQTADESEQFDITQRLMPSQGFISMPLEGARVLNESPDQANLITVRIIIDRLSNHLRGESKNPQET